MTLRPPSVSITLMSETEIHPSTSGYLFAKAHTMGSPQLFLFQMSMTLHLTTARCIACILQETCSIGCESHVRLEITNIIPSDLAPLITTCVFSSYWLRRYVKS